jgi:hypothetical protein
LKGKNPSSGFRKFKVRGLSIINGAQTVASAAEFVAQHPGSNIDDAKVMLTLIKAPADGPFGKRSPRRATTRTQCRRRTSLRWTKTRSDCGKKSRISASPTTTARKLGHRPPGHHARRGAARAGLAQNDPRYAVWLKSEPARLANPESAEYQALFPATLTGVALVNAVLCHRAIRTLVVDYEQKAAARSQKS